MRFLLIQFVITSVAMTFVATSCISSAQTIQLEPAQGILIPAPVANSLRVARSSYGGSSSSYAAPAAQSYSAPAPSSYSAPAAPSYSAPAASAYSAPASPSYSAPAAPAYSASAKSSYSQPAKSSYSAPAPSSSYSAPAASSYSAPAKSSYSAPASIPAPPCPKNYLFSCQPSLTPVACSAPSGGYGASSASSYSAPAAAQHGAYSHHIPQYAVPVVREFY